VTLYVNGAQLKLVEPFDEHGYGVVLTKDIAAVQSGEVSLELTLRQQGSVSGGYRPKEPKKIRWADYDKLIRNEEFFHLLDVERDPDCWRWLELVKTEAIEQWAHSSPWFTAALRHGDPRFFPILELLLRRHVLHLANRRDATALGEFWRWAVPYPSAL